MDTFEYRRLELSTSAFRLVRLAQGTQDDEIECELIYTTLDENVIPYEAVSYTWGTSDKTYGIKLDGRSFKVTANLSSLLHNIRQTKVDRYLWIDAISINQDDDPERGHQVQRMQAIYHGAERVLFYLGELTAEISLLMEFLAILHEDTLGSHWASDDPKWRLPWKLIQYRHHASHGIHTNDILQQGLRQLLHRRWFRRVWILQEVANARRALLCCGTVSIPSQIFALSPTLLEVDLDSHSKTVFDLMPAYSRGVSRKPRKLDLLSALVKCHRLEASDPRDRIFALLGLCADDNINEVLKPDYTQDESAIVHNTITYLIGRDLGPSTTCIEEFLGCLSLGMDHPISEYMEAVLTEMLKFPKMQVQFSLVKTEGIGLSLSVLDAAVSQGLNVEYWTSLLLQHGGRLDMSPRSCRRFDDKYINAHYACLFKKAREIFERTQAITGAGFKIDLTERFLYNEKKELYRLLSHVSGGGLEDLILRRRAANMTYHLRLHQDPRKLAKSYVNSKQDAYRTFLGNGARISHQAAVFAACAVFTMAFMFQQEWNVTPQLNLELEKAEIHDTSTSMALYIAVARRYLPTTRRLFDKGAKIVIGQLPNPLSYAIYARDYDMMGILSEYRASIVGYNGRLPLHCAAEFETIPVVRFLLDQGADLTVVNGDGQTAFDIAIDSGRFGLADLLEAAEEGILDEFDQKAAEELEARDVLESVLKGISHHPLYRSLREPEMEEEIEWKREKLERWLKRHERRQEMKMRDIGRNTDISYFTDQSEQSLFFQWQQGKLEWPESPAIRRAMNMGDIGKSADRGNNTGKEKTGIAEWLMVQERGKFKEWLTGWERRKIERRNMSG